VQFCYDYLPFLTKETFTIRSAINLVIRKDICVLVVKTLDFKYFSLDIYISNNKEEDLE